MIPGQFKKRQAKRYRSRLNPAPLHNTRRMNRYITIACVFLVLITYFWAYSLQESAPPLPSEGEIRVHFIDVGQGDSILIHSADNAVLIDAGPTAVGQGLAVYLEQIGVTVLDYVVATHPHADHIGGMAAVLDRIPVREMWMPDAVHDTATFERLLDAIERNNLEITTVQAGMEISAGLIQMTAVSPNSGGHSNLNNYSIVLHMRHGQTSFLFTGDVEASSEREMIAAGWDLRADVLKVSHHGSRTSTTDEFLDSVQPHAAVIMCAADNQFGHPHREVVDRLNERGIRILRTDELGTIVLSTNGTEIYIYG